MNAPVRAVLDTNCVVSALLFSGGRLGGLLHCWQRGDVVPIMCRETALELLRVLSYPKFALDAADIDDLLSDYVPWAEVFAGPLKRIAVPGLRDGDDAVFISLAVAAKADFLVSGDRHLLELKGIAEHVNILSPSDFLEMCSGLR